jgi:hypothetical protein
MSEKLPKLPFHGAGHERDAPYEFISDQDYEFGGRLVVSGSTCRQFETDVSSWTVWRPPVAPGPSLAKETTTRLRKVHGRL